MAGVRGGLSSVAQGISAGTAHAGVATRRLLILGGTGFLGPHVVDAARRRGFSVTLFNRGKTDPELFRAASGIEMVHGDRDGGLGVLRGRTWDAALDTSGHLPRLVRDAALFLKDAVRQYIYVSSVSVYREMDKVIDESSPLAMLPAGIDAKVDHVTDETFGPLKVLCEREAASVFARRALLIRPGCIVGPRDPTDRFTYWTLRAASGGDALAPGSEGDPVQFIDARDLADWIVAMVLTGQGGTYNAVGPRIAYTMGQLLQACARAAGTRPRWVWASDAVLRRAGVLDKLPLWLPPGQRGLARVAMARALASGLVLRPVDATVRDTLAWARALPAARRNKLRAGLSTSEEQAVLGLLQKVNGGR